MSGGIVSVTVTFRCDSRLWCLIAGVVLSSIAMAQITLATIQGTVLGADGLPLAGTSLTLARKTTEHEGDKVIDFSAKSDAFGRFLFAGLAPGRYSVSATHDGYDYYQGAPLELAAGQRMTGVTIQMPPLAVLSGKVTDEEGNLMPDVQVDILQRDVARNGRLEVGLHEGAGGKTGADGKYRLEVPPGRWYLGFTPSKAGVVSANAPERRYVTTYYPGAVDVSAAAIIEVTHGQQLPELNVRLQKMNVYHVRGKVTGTTLKEPRIAAFRESLESPGDGEPLRPDGTFDIAGVYPGEWVLMASSGEWLGSSSGGSVRVDVTDRDVDNVVVRLNPSVTVRGSVKFVPEQAQSGASPAQPGSEIRLIPLDATGLTSGLDMFMAMEPNPDGTFVLQDAQVGRYRVELALPAGSYVKSILFDGVECIDTGVDVHETAGSGLRITIAMNAAVISGVVTNADGPLPPGAVVTVMPDGPSGAMYRPELHRIVRADAGGHFVVKDLPPGTYRVYAWERLRPAAAEIAFADPEFPRLFDNMSAVVTVGESEPKQVSLNLISADRMDTESR